MADTHLFTHNSAAVIADGDSGWLDTSATNSLSLDIDATVVNGAPGGFPNVQFYLERKQPDGEVYQDWATQLNGPRKFSVGVGPSLEVDKQVGDQVRLRWTLDGGTCTFAASLVGR